MPKTILLNLAIFYALFGAAFFSIWLSLFKQDRANLSAANRRLSWVVLAIATVFWPIVVPFSYRELLAAKKKQKASEAKQTEVDS